MTHHPLRARVRRLELRLAKAKQPGIGETLRRARERLNERHETMTPEAIKAEDLTRWRRLAADPTDESIAAILARARLRLLDTEV